MSPRPLAFRDGIPVVVVEEVQVAVLLPLPLPVPVDSIEVRERAAKLRRLVTTSPRETRRAGDDRDHLVDLRIPE
jgi:hypothetical protein